MARVKRTEAEAAEIKATLAAAAAGKDGWSRVEQKKSLREQRSAAKQSASEAETLKLFGPMVDEIVKAGDWVQYEVKLESAAKALVAAISKTANAKGHGMAAEYAELTGPGGKPLGRYAVQFKARKPRAAKKNKPAANAPEQRQAS